MIVFFKDYKRTDRTYLSVQSVRHLFPNIDIRCLFLYDNDISEYIQYMPKFLELGVSIYFDKKKWNFGNTSAAGSTLNGFYFTEGINKIQALTREYEKVLILDEDSFFTSGETIRFLLDNTFDLACGDWPAPPWPPIAYATRPSYEVNACTLAINPKKLNHLFPILERNESIEILLGHELYDKTKQIENSIILELPTRKYTDYCGDGLHTNNVIEIEAELNRVNIPFKRIYE